MKQGLSAYSAFKLLISGLKSKLTDIAINKLIKTMTLSTFHYALAHLRHYSNILVTRNIIKRNSNQQWCRFYFLHLWNANNWRKIFNVIKKKSNIINDGE